MTEILSRDFAVETANSPDFAVGGWPQADPHIVVMSNCAAFCAGQPEQRPWRRSSRAVGSVLFCQNELAR